MRLVWLCILCLLPLATPAHAEATSDDLIALGVEVVRGVAWAVKDIWMCLQLSAAIDYSDTTTRSFVFDTIKRGHEGNYSIAQVCDLWDRCSSSWRYFSDPLGLASDWTRASETIRLGLRGDCDDFAVLLAAGIRGLGGTAMIRAESTSQTGHAYTLVYIGQSAEDVGLNLLYVMARYNITITAAERGEVGLRIYEGWGAWLSLDWNARHPGSPFWADTGEVGEMHYFPTPSLLWSKPILQAPTGTVRLIEQEFSREQLLRILAKG